MNENELIKLILQGESDKFRIFVEKYRQMVFRTCMGFVHNKEDADDLTQEVFIQAYRSLPDFKMKSAFSTWLYRIAVNRCIDWARKKKPQTVSAICDGSEEELDIYDTIADSGGGPEEDLIKQENAVYLRKLVESLPEIYKTVIILYYFEDFSPQEISEITGVPKRTIDTRLFRGKNLLKLKMEELICGGEQNVLR